MLVNPYCKKHIIFWASSLRFPKYKKPLVDFMIWEYIECFQIFHFIITTIFFLELLGWQWEQHVMLVYKKLWEINKDLTLRHGTHFLSCQICTRLRNFFLKTEIERNEKCSWGCKDLMSQNLILQETEKKPVHTTIVPYGHQMFVVSWPVLLFF